MLRRSFFQRLNLCFQNVFMVVSTVHKCIKENSTTLLHFCVILQLHLKEEMQPFFRGFYLKTAFY